MLDPLEQKLRIPYHLILASASPRRKQLMEGLGLDFEIQPLNANEDHWPVELRAGEVPLYLASHKSGAWTRELKENEILITADTIVWCQDKVLNKPLNFEEGRQMLRALSGKMHEVYTAVHLRSKHKSKSFCDCSKVYFKQLSDDEITYYLNHYKPYDKAGAYGVQDWIGYIGIEKIEGSFYNVMGLPVKLLYENLLIF
ncbi:MAG TPA: Maf family nucleotide pyrophosphatase [Bacteroidia bacterium]|nr:Maf family nucleotide pyrophosphatase [Bacteroidia bacterium]